jgi:hypothetical protein
MKWIYLSENGLISFKNNNLFKNKKHLKEAALLFLM